MTNMLYDRTRALEEAMDHICKACDSVGRYFDILSKDRSVADEEAHILSASRLLGSSLDDIMPTIEKLKNEKALRDAEIYGPGIIRVRFRYGNRTIDVSVCRPDDNCAIPYVPRKTYREMVRIIGGEPMVAESRFDVFALGCDTLIKGGAPCAE